MYIYITSGVVGNFHQLHELQELVEHLLRSSKKKDEVEPIFCGVEWSCCLCLANLCGHAGGVHLAAAHVRPARLYRVPSGTRAWLINITWYLGFIFSFSYVHALAKYKPHAGSLHLAFLLWWAYNIDKMIVMFKWQGTNGGRLVTEFVLFLFMGSASFRVQTVVGCFFPGKFDLYAQACNAINWIVLACFPPWALVLGFLPRWSPTTTDAVIYGQKFQTRERICMPQLIKLWRFIYGYIS